MAHGPLVKGLHFIRKSRGGKARDRDDDPRRGNKGPAGHALGLFVAYGEKDRQIDIHKEDIHGEIEPTNGEAFADNKRAAFYKIHAVHNDEGGEGGDEKYH